MTLDPIASSLRERTRRPDDAPLLFLPADLLPLDVGEADAYEPEEHAPIGWGDASATPATGALEARATVNPWQSSATARSCAALAIAFAPTRRVSRVRFAAAVRAQGAVEIRVPAVATDPRLDYTADIILTGWEVDPARGSWRRLRRSVRRVVLDPRSPDRGVGEPSRFDGILCVDHQLRAGRRYLFQAAFQVGVVSDLRERDARAPYRRRTDEEITRRLTLAGSVTRMSLETLTTNER